MLKSRKKGSKKKTCSQRKVSKVMHEWKTGKLALRSGQKVKSHKQAIAIALNMARKYCGRNSVSPKRTKNVKKRRKSSTRKRKRLY